MLCVLCVWTNSSSYDNLFCHFKDETNDAWIYDHPAYRRKQSHRHVDMLYAVCSRVNLVSPCWKPLLKNQNTTMTRSKVPFGRRHTRSQYNTSRAKRGLVSSTFSGTWMNACVPLCSVFLGGKSPAHFVPHALCAVRSLDAVMPMLCVVVVVAFDADDDNNDVLMWVARVDGALFHLGTLCVFRVIM